MQGNANFGSERTASYGLEPLKLQEEHAAKILSTAYRGELFSSYCGHRNLSRPGQDHHDQYQGDKRHRDVSRAIKQIAKTSPTASGPACVSFVSNGPMNVKTTNWPDICSIVTKSSRTMIRLRATSAQVLRSTGAPISRGL